MNEEGSRLSLESKDADEQSAVVVFDLYQTSEAARVQAFLWEHPDHIPALLEIYPRIWEFFPGDDYGPTFLHPFREPDEEGIGLTIRVQTSRPPREALEVLTRFEDDYLLRDDIYKKLQTLDLAVGLDYV